MTRKAVNMRNFARAVNTPKLGTNLATPGSSIVKGVVEAVQLLEGTISCYIMGDTTSPLTGIAFWDAYTPVVGDNALFLKQGTDLIAIGTVAGASGSTSWTAISYNSGYTDIAGSGGPGAGGPGMYRAIYDNGDVKVQLKGSFTPPGVAGTGLAWTYPAGSVWIPAYERDVTIVTNLSGVVHLQFSANGNVLISNPTATSALLDGLEYFVD